MSEAYGLSAQLIFSALKEGGSCLDCGAGSGHWYQKLSNAINMAAENYYGVEWDKKSVARGVQSGLNIMHCDLNKPLPFEGDKFEVIFALSVLEHLLNGCSFIKAADRTLKKEGKLILLTPNISTYFTAALILAGKMPSSGPHPHSEALIKAEEVYKVSSDTLQSDVESGIPMHRHLVVFSFKVLKKYLQQTGFSEIKGYGFGLYPFPIFLQPVLEKIDPYHCHQMVFIAKK